MSKKITLVFLFILIISIKGHSQTSDIVQTNWNMSPQPPDVTTFQQFGDYPVSYYTGAPQISIPLFSIKENNVEIPITLSYSGNGIRVADQSSWVGLGWNLIPGGYITRMVNGNVEDNHDEDAYAAMLDRWDSETERHYYRSVINNYFEITEDLYSIYDYKIRYDSVGEVQTFNSSVFEMPFVYSFLDERDHMFRPDIYSFSFLGYSGKFFLDPENNYEPVILDKKSHIVIEKDKETNWDPENDGWKITLPNGIVVFFQAIEKVNQAVVNCWNDSYAPSLTWKISKIELLNKEEINFTYNDVTYSTASISESDIYAFEDDNDYAFNQESPKDYQSFNRPYPTINCEKNRKPIEITNNVKVLTRISSPQYQVIFSCDPEETKPRLESMEFYHKSNPSTKQGFNFILKEFKNAETFWNQFGRHGSELTTSIDGYFIKYKLDTLQKYGIRNGVTVYDNPYEFQYTEDIGLPSILSFAQDYWGYYNGQHDNLGLIPDESQMYANGGFFREEDLPDRLPGDDLRARATANRGTSTDHMKQGTINKIVYPTGGYTTFVFEPHKFPVLIEGSNDYLLPADNISYHAPYYTGTFSGDLPQLSIGGGLRIKEIINYDSDGTFSSRKKFDYGESGNLLEPVHFWRIDHNPQLVEGNPVLQEHWLFLYKTWTASSTSYSQSFLIPSSVGYSNVTEIQSDSEFDNENEKINGRTEYSFHNYETLYNPEISRISLNYLDTRNGLPRSITYKDNSGNTVKHLGYEYKKLEESMFLSMNIKQLYSSANYEQNTYTIEYTPIKFELWKEEYVTTTENGVTTKIAFDYSTDKYANIIEKETESSKGENDNLITRYKYPLDYIPADLTTVPTSYHDESIMYTLWQRNMIDKPVETTIERNGNILNGSIMKYDVFPYVENYNDITDGHLILPLEQYQIETATPIESNSFDESDVIYLPSFQKDESYKLKTVLDSYDSNGNLLEYHTENGLHISYIYGYNNRLPVAEAVNSTYSYISTAINQTILDNPPDDQSLRNMLNNIRELSENVMLTSYTYDPLIGITSETDPRGYTTFYDYDGLGRLLRVLDKDGNILKEYKYNYWNSVD